MDYGYGSAGVGQAKENYATDTPPVPSQLTALADDMQRAENRVNGVAERLQRLALAIHGPRPEPANAGQLKGGHAIQDSLAARVRSLHMALDALEGSMSAVMR